MIPESFVCLALFLWLSYVHPHLKHRRERQIKATSASDRAQAKRRFFVEGIVFGGKILLPCIVVAHFTQTFSHLFVYNFVPHDSIELVLDAFFSSYGQ